jgi:hypothetical protein
MKTAIWIKRLGFWGFLFFLVKGLLWLIVPALAVWLTNPRITPITRTE